MIATLISHPEPEDVCRNCHREPAALLGICERCLPKTAWFIEPFPGDYS